MKNKNITKLLNQTLVVYVLALVVILAIKIMGFDYFEIDVGNSTISKVNNFVNRYNLVDFYYAITMVFYAYIIISIANKDKSSKMKKYVLSIAPLLFVMKIISTKINILPICLLLDIGHLLLFTLFYARLNKQNIKNVTHRYLKIFVIMFIFQIISSIARVGNLNTYDYGFMMNAILDIDYTLLSLILYKIVFMEGECLCLETEVGSYLRKLSHLRNLPTKLLKNLSNKLKTFNDMSKEDKLTHIIFIPIFLLYNIFTLVFVLFIAMLNDTAIECVFLLSSFIISKSVFGDEFHFKNMLTCFIVSNLTYYTLNRVTLPIEISIMTSVILGVGLAYITSLFVKNKLSKLYRGMPLDVFQETILKVTDENSDDYKICKLFYIDKWSDNKISMKINYSVSSVKLKKKKINNKILEL